MASYYVWSGATGTGTGASWANAYTTLTLAYSGKVAGDTFYVAHDHAESTAAAITLTTAGTLANPSKVICASRSGSVPPVSADRRATAQVATTGATSHINFTANTHYDGIIFVCGNAANSTSIVLPSATTGTAMRFDNCSLRINTTASASRILIGNQGSVGGSYIEWNNTTASFGATSQAIDLGGVFKWRNTPSALLGTIPSTVFALSSAGRSGLTECIGVDFSAAGSGKTIVGQLASASGVVCKFVDCKLDAAVTKAAAPLSPGSTEVDFVRSSASGNYAVASYRYSGTLTEETTIVRAGGSTDGTTPISWKIVTTANSSYSSPFVCPPVAIWNDTTGSARTATIEGIWGGGAVPLDSEIWVDVEYLGDASSPQGSFINDGAADLLTAGANQTSSSATWGGSTTKFKLNVTFTAQQKGWVYARVKCAKASSTFYVDPLVTLT